MRTRLVERDGRLGEPEGADDVALSDFRNWPGLGGLPGTGLTVVYGRVDASTPCKNGTVPPPCQAVFWDLSRLMAGDQVILYWEGTIHAYRVTNLCYLDKADFRDEMFRSTPQETLLLITGAGFFVNNTYTHNLLVRATKDQNLVTEPCTFGSPARPINTPTPRP